MEEFLQDVKIVMLKTGHHIITKINELTLEGEENPFCFLLTAPLVITYKNIDDDKLDLSFTLWCPFSKSVEFRVPFEHVISIGDPKDDIYLKYMEIAHPLFDSLKQMEEDKKLEELFSND